MDSVRSGPYGQIFRPDNFVFGQVCCLRRHNSLVVLHVASLMHPFLKACHAHAAAACDGNDAEHVPAHSMPTTSPGLTGSGASLTGATLHACRRAQATTGPRVTTQRAPSSSTPCWTSSARRPSPATASKVRSVS